MRRIVRRGAPGRHPPAMRPLPLGRWVYTCTVILASAAEAQASTLAAQDYTGASCVFEMTSNLCLTPALSSSANGADVMTLHGVGRWRELMADNAYRSVSINNPGCQITLYADVEFQGGVAVFTATGTNQCIDSWGRLDRAASSATTSFNVEAVPSLNTNSPQACGATHQEMRGNDVQHTTYTGSTEAEKDASCCAACHAHSDCEFWVRSTQGTNCWLKAGFTGYTASSIRRGAHKACIDLSGSYDHSDGTTVLTQEGCSGTSDYPWSYTVIGMTASIPASGVTGTITGTAGAYVIHWSNGHTYTMIRQQANSYVRLGNRQYCQPGQDITDQTECQLAASALGLAWTGVFDGPGDHRYCLFADDSRQSVYFNTAGSSASPTPPNDNYASLCHQALVPLTVSTPNGFSNPNNKVIAGNYAVQSSLHNSKALWRSASGMELRWSNMWTQWIFDDDADDTQSVAWKSYPGHPQSSHPGFGTYTNDWRFGSASGNNGAFVPSLTIAEAHTCDGSTVAVTCGIIAQSSFELVGNEYIWLPPGTGNSGEPDPKDAAARFQFFCEDATEVVSFEMEVIAPNGGDDSFYVGLNGADATVWHIQPQTSTWSWRSHGTQYYVAAGWYELKVYPREDGAKLRAVSFASGSSACRFEASVSVIASGARCNSDQHDGWLLAHNFRRLDGHGTMSTIEECRQLILQQSTTECSHQIFHYAVSGGSSNCGCVLPAAVASCLGGSTFAHDGVSIYLNTLFGQAGDSHAGCQVHHAQMLGIDVGWIAYTAALTDEDEDSSCCAACTAHPDCEFWVRSTETRDCWLKAGFTGYSPDASRRGGHREPASYTWTTVFLNASLSCDRDWLLYIERDSSAIQSEWSCKGMCEHDPDCNAVSFIPNRSCKAFSECRHYQNANPQHTYIMSSPPVGAVLDVRLMGLVNGVAEAGFEGRVEVYHDGAWGTVCDDGFEDIDAAVVCRQLGTTGGQKIQSPGFSSGAPERIWLDEVQCQGDETSLTQCSHDGWGTHNCVHAEDVYISCGHPGPSNNLRLTDNADPTQIQGRVEVFHDNAWGTVCDDSFWHVDAQVVCRQLGAAGGVAMTYSPAPLGDEPPADIWLDDVQCTGDEEALTDCQHNGWGNHNCGHGEDVYVRCEGWLSSTPAPSSTTTTSPWPTPLPTPRPTPQPTWATPPPSTITHWAVDGCADGGYGGDMQPQKLAIDRYAGVQCCFDVEDPAQFARQCHRTTCAQSVTYQEAERICTDRGFVVCSLDQFASLATCCTSDQPCPQLDHILTWTSTPAAQDDGIQFPITVRNLNFASLIADDSLRESFTSAIKMTVSSNTGVSTNRILVSLFDGSVLASVMVVPYQGTDVSAVTAQIDNVVNSGGLANDVLTAVQIIPGIYQYSTGPLTVETSSPGTGTTQPTEPHESSFLDIMDSIPFPEETVIGAIGLVVLGVALMCCWYCCCRKRASPPPARGMPGPTAGPAPKAASRPSPTPQIIPSRSPDPPRIDADMERNMSTAHTWNGSENPFERVENEGVRNSLAAMLVPPESTRKTLGYGADTKVWSKKYTALTLQDAWEINQSEQREFYQTKRKQVAKQMKIIDDRNPGLKRTAVAPTLLDNNPLVETLSLDDSINEKLLLHGTNAHTVLQIVNTGFDEKMTTRGSFGNGAYLAEDPSKVDQYCRADSATATEPDAIALHEFIYGNKEHPGDVCYVIVCQAILGCPMYTKQAVTDRATGKARMPKSARGDTAACDENQNVFHSDRFVQLACAPNVSFPHHSLVVLAKQEADYDVKRHREFVIFDGKAIIPRYLIAYKRT